MANDSPYRYMYTPLNDYNQWSLNVREHPATWTAIMARGACLSFKAHSDAVWTRLDRSCPGDPRFNVYNVAIDGDLHVMQDMEPCFCIMTFDLTACQTAQWMYWPAADTYIIDFECTTQPIPDFWSDGT